MASIVVSGDVLRRPHGSNVATHLQYLIGLRKLGHQVVYLEDRGVEDPGLAAYAAAAVPRAGLVLMRDLLRRCRVDVEVVWVDPDAGLVGGMVWPQLRRRLSKADLLIDLGGHCWLEERSLARRRVMIDVDSAVGPLDPGRNQLEHDLCFSARRDPTTLPDADWLPTVPPVVPRLWYGPPTRAELPLRVRLDAPDAPTGAGESGSRGISAGELPALAGRISPRPWTALPADDAQRAAALVDAGWSVRGEEELDASLSSFRAGMLGSQALLGASGAGAWFTSLDACHLAAARPVIVAGGEVESWLPTGSGLIAADGFDDAVEAVERIQPELARHAAAARAVAVRVFDFRVVLPGLIEQALPRRLQVVA